MTERTDRDRLLAQVRATLANADRMARRYRAQHRLLLTVALVSGGLATLLAGDASVGSPTVASWPSQLVAGVTPSELGLGWKIVCGLVAVCAFVGTVATGAQSVLGVGDDRMRAMVCAGKLQAIAVQLETAAGLPDEALAAHRDELARVVVDYPEYCR